MRKVESRRGRGASKPAWVSLPQAATLEGRRLLSGGTIDTTYGSAGVATVGMGATTLVGSTSAVQSDGKLLVPSEQGTSGHYAMTVTRLDADGSRDATYGAGGTATAGFFALNDNSGNTQLALGADGKAVLAGNGDGLNGANAYAAQVDVERFTATGAADATFGTGGIVKLAPSGLTHVGAVAVDAAGHVFVAGETASGLAVARLTSAGALDINFGQDGISTVPLTGSAGSISTLAFEADGSLLVGGGVAPSGSSDGAWTFAHLTHSGEWDSSFGSSGLVTTPFDQWSPTALVPLPGGGFVTGGMIDDQAGLAQYTAAGQLDPSFGSAGVTTPTGGTGLGSFQAYRNADGTIVYGGVGSTTTFVGRVTAAGVADVTFGQGGEPGLTAESVPESVSQSVTGDGSFAVGPDGSGYVVASGSGSNFYVAKFSAAATAMTGVGTVTGSVYVDPYDNGSPGYGGGLYGRVVYADVNGNGQLDAGEPSATTDYGGTYTLTGVPAGLAVVRDVLPAGYYHSVASGAGAAVTVVANGTVAAAGLGEVQPLAVSGVVVLDANGNGVRDVTEGPLAGCAVYWDVNGNGVLDAGEPSTVTAADGTYTLGGLVPTTAQQTAPTLRLALPASAAGDRSETPAAGFGFNSGITYRFDWFVATASYVYGSVQLSTSAGLSVLGGQTVYADLDGSGTLSAGDVSATTDGNGRYALSGLPAGSVPIRVVVPTGYTLTAGQTGSFTASVGKAVTSSYGTFVLATTTPAALASTGGLYGRATDDANDNGVFDASELPVANQTVYIDVNGDGVRESTEPTAVTDAAGQWSFPGLAAGTYTVRQALPADRVQTYPAGSAGLTETLGVETGGRVDQYGGLGFESHSSVTTGGVSGAVFADANDDGVRQSGESGLAGVTVYLVPAGYVYAAGDNPPAKAIASATTAADGTFTFPAVAAGAYAVVEPDQAATAGYDVLHPSSHVVAVTVTAGQTAANVAFADAPESALTGTVTTAAGVALGGVWVYLDANGDGQFEPALGERSTTTNAKGSFTFADVVAGTYVVRQVVPSGYAVQTPAAGGYPLTLPASPSGLNFVDVPLGGTLSGTVFADANGNGVADATEAGVAGVVVFLDANGNGTADVGEATATTNAAGGYTFANVPAGTAVVRPVVPAGSVVTAPSAAAYTVTATTGSTTAGLNFGLFKAETLTGRVYDDANASGQQDLSETGLAGLRVYVDANEDGTFDAGDPSAVTAANGVYTITGVLPPTGKYDEPSAYVAVPAGYQAEVGAAGVTIKSGYTQRQDFALTRQSYVSGAVFRDLSDGSTENFGGGFTVYADLNKDGTFDAGDVSTLTQGAGLYSFAGLPTGSVTIRLVVPAGYVIAAGTAASTTVTVGTLTHGYASFNLTYALAGTTPGDFFGRAFQDANGNGTFDPGESPAVGRTIYIDANGNGQLDPGEATSVTDTAGLWYFNNLPAGTYTFRQVLPAGATQTLPVGTGGFTYTLAASAYGNVILDGNSLPFGSTPVTGSISGTVFADANGNGVQDGLGTTTAEAGLAGVTVYVDADGTGTLTAADPRTTTSATGTWSIAGVPAGGARIRQVVPAGYAASAPAAGYFDVTVAGGGTATGLAFADRPATAAVVAQLTAATFGTAGSYANSGNTIAKATDGSLTTFFDSAATSGSFVGLDLGSAEPVTAIEFAPRSGYASRMTGGLFQASNDPAFLSGVVTVGTVATAPASGKLTAVTPSTSAAYRYWRYVGPTGGHCDVAEFQLFGTAAPKRLAGTTIGTAGSNKNGGNTIAKATDGSTATFYDGLVADGNWVGLDLGAATSISQIRFAPRSGFTSRMVGGSFQVSTTADFSAGVTTVYTIAAPPAAGVLTTATLAGPVTARYVRYLSPAGSFGDVAEFQAFG